MNANHAEELYVKVKDTDGAELVCPYDTVTVTGRIRESGLDDCIEQEVIGRYAGNIKIVEPLTQ
ncbi:MAG: hypothetical protein QNJ22_16135 [Desulfosarcinaceae bacterium]|nr:hypothetical protein [Desulfosarcinaceae bacterium]